MRQGIDWDYLLVAANLHGIIPALYYRFTESCPWLIPEQPMAQLHAKFREIAGFNIGLTSQLLKLVALFKTQGIPMIAYKGPALAVSAFGDVTRRQFRDLDLLIRKQDLWKVKQLFVANGYRPGWNLTSAQEAAVARYHYEYPFRCKDKPILVEVHWELAEHFFSFELEVDQLWDRLDTVSVYGRQLPTLSAEDSLIVLCAHGAKHLWKRLGWIYDIAHLIGRRKDIDWRLVIDRANALGSIRMVWLGLLLSNDLLGAEVPNDLMQMVRADPVALTLAESLIGELFRETPESSGIFRTAILQMRMRERVRDRLKYGFRLTVTTKLIDSLYMPMGRPR
jgi:hypothetical protein